jgi:hypothetical protein
MKLILTSVILLVITLSAKAQPKHDIGKYYSLPFTEYSLPRNYFNDSLVASFRLIAPISQSKSPVEIRLYTSIQFGVSSVYVIDCDEYAVTSCKYTCILPRNKTENQDLLKNGFEISRSSDGYGYFKKVEPCYPMLSWDSLYEVCASNKLFSIEDIFSFRECISPTTIFNDPCSNAYDCFGFEVAQVKVGNKIRNLALTSIDYYSVNPNMPYLKLYENIKSLFTTMFNATYFSKL